MGQQQCSGTCIDVSAARQNCGACGHVCADSELCQSGKCIQNTTDCRPGCEGGQRCDQAQCVCEVGQLFCAERCVDPQSDAAHCGTCEAACGAKQACRRGTCTCDAGRSACGKSCIDLQTDPANCGACGHACSDTQQCARGACRSVWSDDCLDEGAYEVELRQLDAYQSIKVPIHQLGGPVALTDRIADIVQGRATTFRLSIDVSTEFAARQLSARLTLKNNGLVARYWAKQSVDRASSDADVASTFVISVPASAVGSDTSYAVEVVECSAASGRALTTRFPRSGEAALSARKTGNLKLRIIPVLIDNAGASRVPDTSAAALSVYRNFIEAMYPIEHAELTVGKQISTSYPIEWTTLVEQIRAQRASDAPAPDVYYYGMVQPTETLAGYCSQGCTAGVGYVAPLSSAGVRVAVGLAYADELSASTLAHELGHNHGRKHAPCPADISGVDENAPGDGLETWGYDSRNKQFLDPSMTFDIMGYCPGKWVSDYNYRALVQRVAEVSAPDGITVSDIAPLASYRVLIVDSNGPRWSLPLTEPIAAYGDPELADVLDIDDQPIAQVIVYRSQLSENAASTLLVPEPEADWNAIRVEGALPLSFAAPVTVPAPQ